MTEKKKSYMELNFLSGSSWQSSGSPLWHDRDWHGKQKNGGNAMYVSFCFYIYTTTNGERGGWFLLSFFFTRQN